MQSRQTSMILIIKTSYFFISPIILPLPSQSPPTHGTNEQFIEWQDLDKEMAFAQVINGVGMLLTGMGGGCRGY